MRDEWKQLLPTHCGMIEGPEMIEPLPYDQLRQELLDNKYLSDQDPQYFHIMTFWAIWHDPDYGSNQAVFLSLQELCDWIAECGGFMADDLMIVEEVSSVHRS